MSLRSVFGFHILACFCPCKGRTRCCRGLCGTWGVISGVKAIQSCNKWGCIFRIIPAVAALSSPCVGLPYMQSKIKKRIISAVKGIIWWITADKAVSLLREKRLAFPAIIGRPVIFKCHGENGSGALFTRLNPNDVSVEVRRCHQTPFGVWRSLWQKVKVEPIKALRADDWWCQSLCF